jgi:hypothetical protein
MSSEDDRKFAAMAIEQAAQSKDENQSKSHRGPFAKATVSTFTKASMSSSLPSYPEVLSEGMRTPSGL